MTPPPWKKAAGCSLPWVLQVTSAGQGTACSPCSDHRGRDEGLWAAPNPWPRNKFRRKQSCSHPSCLLLAQATAQPLMCPEAAGQGPEAQVPSSQAREAAGIWAHWASAGLAFTLSQGHWLGWLRTGRVLASPTVKSPASLASP